MAAQAALPSHRRTVIWLALMVAAMVALGFASVPLYRLFCEATGWNGTTRKSLNAIAPGPIGKIVSVRFDANVKPGMGWRFAPDQRVMRVAIGARQMAFFTATNDTDHTITGSAVFNVTPSEAGAYFTKIQCFCFTEQTLKAGQTVDMPVIFFVDPKIREDEDTKDIDEITLSYTFYPVETPGASR